MHELPVTQSIIDSVLAEVEKLGIKSVSAVHLKLGRMTTFVPECLKFYYEILSADTALEGSALVVEEIDVTARCNNCGERLTFEEPVFICPVCGSTDLDVLTGREVLIESVEVPDEGEVSVGD